MFAAIYDLVRRIPPGKVATYGQISHYVAGSTPRIVGFALAGVKPGSDIPWQRVINARGEISPHRGGEGSSRQRDILEDEGIEFDRKGRIDLNEFGWRGP
jgi:methylated-DNA-protein-cysteine methyltransferase-like protein